MERVGKGDDIWRKKDIVIDVTQWKSYGKGGDVGGGGIAGIHRER